MQPHARFIAVAARRQEQSPSGWPQVFSACVMSFAHGSNDVANAMGPFSGIYYIWETRQVPTKAPVPPRCTYWASFIMRDRLL